MIVLLALDELGTTAGMRLNEPKELLAFGGC